MKAATLSTIQLAGRQVDYRLIHSKAAKRLQVRVGPAGVEVVQPANRPASEVEAFLHANDAWIIAQLERVERLCLVRRPHTSEGSEILYRGAFTPVRVVDHAHRQGPAKVIFEQERLSPQHLHQGSADPLGKLFLPPKSLLQLAADHGPRIRAALSRDP